MPKCNKCKEFLHPDRFCKNLNNRSGLTSWCKTCINERSKISKRKKKMLKKHLDEQMKAFMKFLKLE
jgi:myosin-crossreactive antigen